MCKKIVKATMQSLIALGIWGGFVSIGLAQEGQAPEGATGLEVKSSVTAQKFMVAAANPHAVRAGYQILKEGGSAVDAAIAVQMVLNVVEPQSSGIGGGAFLLYWDQAQGKLSTFDGRETAPQAASEDLFLKPDGTPRKWRNALAGGRAVGTPGVLRMLEMAHKKHGKLPWKRLFHEAIILADQGFPVSARLSQQIAKRFNPALGRYDAAWHYFYPDGKPIVEGRILKNPQLADTFRRIAELGADAFYKGDIAIDIVNTVRNALDNPGLLTAADLYNYQAKQREPVCGQYRSYQVCGMGPPTSGGITVLQILSILSHFDLSQYAPDSVEAVHLFAQAGRLAYADRGMYLADMDFVKVPIKELLDPSYLQKRSQLISLEKDMGAAQAGELPKDLGYVEGFSPELPSTSHQSIVDAEGNAVSMTMTIETGFGSTLMVRGFLLNNELTDFSFRHKKDGQLVANRVQGGKRPRSSMSPTMIFDDKGQLKMIIGSPGGSRIINYVAQTIISVLDWKMGIQEAVGFPHYVNRNGTTDLEKGTPIANLQSALESMGYSIRVRDLNSGLHGILLSDQGMTGGADPRREGIVMGE